MKKSRVAAAFIALIGGSFGLHKFYLKDPGAGIFYIILMFMTARLFPVTMLLGFIDAIKMFSMSDEDFDMKYNTPKSRRFRDRRRRRREPVVERRERTMSNERERYHYNTKKKRKRDNPFKRSADKKYQEFDLEEAIEDYQKALDISPEDSDIHFNMAAVYSLLEKKGEAFKSLETAINFGYKNIDNIGTLDDLAYLRIQPEFELFKNNGYKLSQRKTLEAPKKDLLQDDLLLSQLNKLKDLRSRGLLSPKEFEYEKEKLLRK